LWIILWLVEVAQAAAAVVAVVVCKAHQALQWAVIQLQL